MIRWHGDGVPEVHCAAGVLAKIVEAAMEGYRQYPWGGVEFGGVLLGEKGPGTVVISTIREGPCEHHHGPEFELSNKDYEAFERLLGEFASDVELEGLTPLGWYQTTSRRNLDVSEHGRALFQRFFPEPGQVAIVVQRSKRNPPSIGIFLRDSNGATKLHSPIQELTNQFLTQSQHQAPAESA